MPATALNRLDQERGKLEARHPGWRIWYVPHAVGGITWCAVREPTLNTDSPEHLSDDIREVERESGAQAP